MIIVAGHVRVDAANVEDATKIVLAMMRETRREDGCRRYDITHSVETPGQFHVYEEWDDLPALEAHFATPHMKAFRDGLANLTVLERSVARLEAGERTPL